MILSTLFTLATLATVGLTAKLEQVSNWGTNPSKIQMYIYVPDKVSATPAIIVAVSYIPLIHPYALAQSPN